MKRKLVVSLMAVAALVALTWGLVTAASSSSTPSFASTATYEVSITNLTRGQPLSPIFIATHLKDAGPLYTLGQPASAELAALAEDADTAGVMAAWNPEANAMINETRLVTGAAGPIRPGETVTATFEVSGTVRYLTLASMLVSTNDAFIGANGVELYDRRLTLVGYDAGSEANTEDCAYVPGPPCGSHVHDDTNEPEGFVHVHAGIHGGSGLDPAQHDWRNPVAVMVIERIS